MIPPVLPLNKQPIIIITGPTGSGKSNLIETIHARKDLNPIEIVTADSRQVYIGMNIGTDKPSQYTQQQIPHHLIDIVTPDRLFSAGEFLNRAQTCIRNIAQRNATPFIVGGTGLYIRSLIGGLATVPPENPELRESLRMLLQSEGADALYDRLVALDPKRANQIQKNDHRRIIRAIEIVETTGKPVSDVYEGHRFEESSYRVLMFVLNVSRSKLYSRIDDRVDQMLRCGLISEVESLISRFGQDAVGLEAIGYRQIRDCLLNKISQTEAIRLIKQETRRYAKRQLTWFRKEPLARWIDHDPDHPMSTISDMIQSIKLFLSGHPLAGQSAELEFENTDGVYG